MRGEWWAGDGKKGVEERQRVGGVGKERAPQDHSADEMD